MSGYGLLIVARFRDGTVVGGTTADFREDRESFHVVADGTASPIRVAVEELKAVFFVKTLIGNHVHQESKSFRHRAAEAGGRRKVWVEFLDGEELAGFTDANDPALPGFFLYPADSQSNIERAFVIRKAMRAYHENEAAEQAALVHEGRPKDPRSAVGLSPDRWDEMLGIRPSPSRRGPAPRGKSYFLGDW